MDGAGSKSLAIDPMTRQAKKAGPSKQWARKVLHRMGWSPLGQLERHYRPLLVLASAPCSWEERVVLWLFLRSVPDASRITVLRVKGGPNTWGAAWEAQRATCSWMTCIGIDARHKAIAVHRPFPPGPHADRERSYMARYLSYFTTQPFTPPIPSSAEDVPNNSLTNP